MALTANRPQNQQVNNASRSSFFFLQTTNISKITRDNLDTLISNNLLQLLKITSLHLLFLFDQRALVHP